MTVVPETNNFKSFVLVVTLKVRLFLRNDAQYTALNLLVSS